MYALLIKTISHSLPKVESDLNSYRKSLEGVCKSLEDKMDLFGFLPSKGKNISSSVSGFDKENSSKQNQSESSSSTSGSELTRYLSDLPAHYASIRRKEILVHAREMVLSDYHNTMVATGDACEDELSSAGDIGDPSALLDQSGSYVMQKLKFDSCQMSLAVCRLLKYVHEVMKQAGMASPKVANVLFQSARDCFEIYMAIVPIKFKDVISTVPRMGAVFYNDCLYMIHNTILIAHKYKKDLATIDEVLESSAGFADFIPRLR